MPFARSCRRAATGVAHAAVVAGHHPRRPGGRAVHAGTENIGRRLRPVWLPEQGVQLDVVDGQPRAQPWRNDSRSRKRPGLPHRGSALKSARTNLAAAGLDRIVSLKQADVLEISAPAKEGIIVTNPPYGVRLGEQQELAQFYPKLGDALKKKFSGWRAYLLSADMRLPKLIHLAASKRTPLFNGALECRLFEYRMVEGGMRKKKTEA